MAGFRRISETLSKPFSSHPNPYILPQQTTGRDGDQGLYAGPFGIGEVGLVCSSHARYSTELLSQDPFSDSFRRISMKMSSRRTGLKRGSVTQHRPKDIDPPTRQRDQSLSVPLALSSL